RSSHARKRPRPTRASQSAGAPPSANKGSRNPSIDFHSLGAPPEHGVTDSGKSALVIPIGFRGVRYGFVSHVFCAMNLSFLGFPLWRNSSLRSQSPNAPTAPDPQGPGRADQAVFFRNSPHSGGGRSGCGLPPISSTDKLLRSQSPKGNPASPRPGP